MATRDERVPLKKQSILQNFSEKNQYSSVNFNQSHKCFNVSFVQSNNKSISNNSKDFGYFKSNRITAATLKIDSQILHDEKRLWNKSSSNILQSKVLKSFIAIEKAEENVKTKRWKNDSSTLTRSSTLSFHIAAYENLIEGGDTVTSDENGCLKKDLFNEQKQILIYSALNPFEFPRQQTDDKTGPAVMQFTASQQLLNPNQSKLSDNNQRGTRNVAGVRPALVHFKQRPPPSSAQSSITDVVARNWFTWSINKEPLYKTGNSDLDKYLEGGLPLGKLIHIYGPSGVGKSQLCMQLAANMWKQDKVLPCYFLCCNKLSFVPSRYLEICSELKIDKSAQELLSNVFIAELTSVEDLVDTLNDLTGSDKQIGLVCIEGVFDYSNYDEEGERFAFCEGLGQAMLSLSELRKCLTIFVNQVRASFQSSLPSDVVPALGQRFYLHSLFRILMDFQSEERTIKKIQLDRWTIPQNDPFLFTLTKRGITTFRPN